MFGISKTLGVIIGAARWVFYTIKSWFQEEDIRKIQTRIRHSKKRVYATRIKNALLIEDIRSKRGDIEYTRRKVISNYYQAQITFIDSVVVEILKIQGDTATQLESLRKNVNANLGRERVELKELKTASSALHERIASSKSIMVDLNHEKNHLIHLIKVLMEKDYEHYRKHHALGGKKLINEILSGNREALEEEYGKLQVVQLDYLTFRLDRKCKSCGCYTAGITNYCIVCGASLSQDPGKVKFLKKDAKDLCCEECYCPVLDNWEYCPNCQNELDHYSLKEAIGS